MRGRAIIFQHTTEAHMNVDAPDQACSLGLFALTAVAELLGS